MADRSSTYVLQGGEKAAERLETLAAAAWRGTERLLGRIGVAHGWSCLDVGCGSGDVAIRLADIVGPEGRVVGEDFDEGILDVARSRARREGARVEFVAGSILDRASGEACDLVYARFLLSHLAAPMDALARMLGSVRPGGIVAVEDVDFHSHFCWPPGEAFARYDALYRETALRLGADPLIGPKLPGMFLDLGLEDVGLEVVEPLFHEGPGKRMPELTMEHIRGAVVETGAATDEEVDAIVAELGRLRRDPRSVMGFPRVFQVWGRRPGA
ncbi:MAG: methyltransferase domain-containing protein [Gemmatimonadota bacterium]|nr:methyltransferase domain-containing protein [Gemmatimonadota bacterium]